MARWVTLGALAATVGAFGCGSGGGATDGGTDGGVDAGGILGDVSEADDALVDGVCECLEVSISKAACALIIDLYGELPDGGVPDLYDLAAFRMLTPDEQECVEGLIEENPDELEPFFDCQVGVASDGASCYDEVASSAFSGECNEEAVTACRESVESDLGDCASLPEPLAGELNACVAGTATEIVDGFIDVYDKACECEGDPTACREMFAPLSENRTCLIDEIGSASQDVIDCAVEWMDRAEFCFESVPACGEDRDFCTQIGIAGLSICPGGDELLEDAFMECGVTT